MNKNLRRPIISLMFALTMGLAISGGFIMKDNFLLGALSIFFGFITLVCKWKLETKWGLW